MNNAVLGEKKNMNLPGTEIDLPTITEKDENDLKNFGVKHSFFENLFRGRSHLIILCKISR